MLSDHKSPYVGRFACDWPRLSTTDPHAALVHPTPGGNAYCPGTFEPAEPEALPVLAGVAPSSTVTSDWLMRLLRKLGTTVDIAGLTDEGIQEHLQV